MHATEWIGNFMRPEVILHKSRKLIMKKLNRLAMKCLILFVAMFIQFHLNIFKQYLSTDKEMFKLILSGKYNC